VKDWLIPLVTLILGSGLATFTTLLLVPSQIRKLRGETNLSGADAAAKLSAASVAILEPAQKELARMTAQLEVAREKIDDLTGQVSALCDEVQMLRRENAMLRSVG
jgi:hypothetical protein